MDIFRQEFGKRLRAARLKARLKQREIAKVAGDVDPTAVSNWENGKDFPDDERLPAICKILGVDQEYFTAPTNVIHSDPLPEWAEKISNRLEALEERQLKPPARGYHLDPPEEIAENWGNLSLKRQFLVLYLATEDEKYKQRLGQKIISHIEALLQIAGEKRLSLKKQAR